MRRPRMSAAAGSPLAGGLLLGIAEMRPSAARGLDSRSRRADCVVNELMASKLSGSAVHVDNGMTMPVRRGISRICLGIVAFWRS